MCFYVSVNQFIPMLHAFVVLGLVSSVLGQAIGSEERLGNDVFCVEWLSLIHISEPTRPY